MSGTPPDGTYPGGQHLPQEGRLGFFATCIGVIKNPETTFSRLAEDHPVRWALALVVGLAFLGSLINSGTLSSSTLFGREIGFALKLGYVVLSPIGAIVAVAFWAALLMVSSRLLGGKGTYRGLFVGTAFADVPAALHLPVLVIASAVGPILGAIVGVIGLLFFAWTMLLTVYAIQANNQFSTARSIAALVLPLGLFLVLSFALTFAIIILFVIIAIVA
ncbi:MAG: hypothetical protein C1O27_001277 [Chloroflexi bacterium]|nr:MAG: hypothetical protein C1O27_001277 [Chloroflexota bacterium]